MVPTLRKSSTSARHPAGKASAASVSRSALPKKSAPSSCITSMARLRGLSTASSATERRRLDGSASALVRLRMSERFMPPMNSSIDASKPAVTPATKPHPMVMPNTMATTARSVSAARLCWPANHWRSRWPVQRSASDQPTTTMMPASAVTGSQAMSGPPKVASSAKNTEPAKMAAGVRPPACSVGRDRPRTGTTGRPPRQPQTRLARP